ncbi:MAG: ABC transporter substrate-binding protein [Candidatus Eisenbacteria bacterium]|nr:ABC transporter substrate-binding protein [Candidatus Eisenbacteria bacterium]
MKRSSLLLATIALAFACAAPAAPARERVVCVSKQLNEFLFAIGAEDVLVAHDLTSVYPPRIRKLPSVGYHRALSAEGILSVKPTLLLTDGNVGPEAVLDQVRSVGIPVVTMRAGAGPEGAESLLTALGRRFHREARAAKVVADWRAGMQQVYADSTKAPGPRPRVLMMHFGQIINNYLGVRSGSTGDRILRWAGGVNAIDSVGGMSRLTPELIAKCAPEVILATDVGFDRVGSAAKFAQLPGVALTPAAKSGRIYRIDETEIMYFGPRTPAAVRHIASLIHAKGGK